MNYAGWLYRIDTGILYLLNVKFENPIMDQVWLALTHLERQWWFVLIIAPLILIRVVYIYRFKTLKLMFGVGLAVALSDMICYRIIKMDVERPRPFDDPRISAWVRHVGDAHGASFPSNHAANCFAGAVILSWFFPLGRDLFYVFAFFVGLSRIALGVHYPSDVLGGAILGLVVGFLVKFLLLSRFNFFRLENRVSTSNTGTYNWRKRIRRLEDD
jgi:undecaprenyl-diphosphatase